MFLEDKRKLENPEESHKVIWRIWNSTQTVIWGSGSNQWPRSCVMATRPTVPLFHHVLIFYNVFITECSPLGHFLFLLCLWGNKILWWAVPKDFTCQVPTHPMVTWTSNQEKWNQMFAWGHWHSEPLSWWQCLEGRDLADRVVLYSGVLFREIVS